MGFLGLSCLSLVKAVRVGIGGTPGTVEPVKVGFVIRDEGGLTAGLVGVEAVIANGLLCRGRAASP